jgi:DNA-binding MarR family transcriptional regulator/GNAT superfamily N-acetyltransferase
MLPTSNITCITRLKRVTDRMMRDIQSLYGASGSAMQLRWLPVCTLLYEQGPKPISSLAVDLQVSHAAISQLADELANRGFAATYRDPRDRRKRVLALSKTGKELVEDSQSLQEVIEGVAGELLEEAGESFRQASDKLRRALDRQGFGARYLEFKLRGTTEAIEILDFSPELAPAFDQLNRNWILADFAVVEADERVLKEPQKEIIFPGGAIVFARDLQTGEILGTGGLVNHHDGTGEIVKMAVDEVARGRRIGRRVAEALLQRARDRGMHRLYLETNSKLVPALGLYETLGFTSIEIDPDSDFDRADIRMMLDL